MSQQPVPPEDRGTLHIADAVVRKVAQRTADLVPGTARAQRKVAGVGIGTTGSTAKVTCQGNEAEVQLDIAVHYPTPIRPVVAEIRERVIDEVARITAYRVRGVKVTVSALLPETQARVE
ncbi:putative alkaline shock family protein YloU [Tamaricihabitans halophyticus]|uniref:Putative alkaline shock family protein YloU n=1 Tax=Tamaricihabitans halophyticus TaxID=1262583 RepID=A0A4R2QYG0_9PSEU|nr:Asp23/Gls24 family envelope stress response protein [Tamaricihabitans halophyticus]TCP55280.1 putative alkaline shock family protein YloU [Tamaricihabitans halophyticus]